MPTMNEIMDYSREWCLDCGGEMKLETESHTTHASPNVTGSMKLVYICSKCGHKKTKRINVTGSGNGW